jgi:hypothetical protein
MDMTQPKLYFLLLMVMVALASCTGAVYSPTTASPVTESIMPSTYTPSPIRKSTVRPTRTIEPSQTIEPTFAAVKATLDSVAKNYSPAETLSYSCTVNYCDDYISPDGVWAVFPDADATHGASIDLIQIRGEKHWQIFSDFLYGKPEYDNSIDVSHWAVNGKYAYISRGYSLDGGYVGEFGGGTRALSQLNLDSGKVIPILGTQEGFYFSDVAFSSDDLYLAYVENSDNSDAVSIKVFDTLSGKVISSYPISAKYKSAGRIAWSPDSQKIIFAAEVSAWWDAPNVQSSLFLVDLQKDSIQKLIADQKDLVIPYAWTETGQILVYRTLPNPDAYREYYYFDLSKKVFSSQVTLTPAP